MRCAECLLRLNETLDRRQSALGDDLVEHLATCDSCHKDWHKLKSCADLLGEKTLSPNNRFTDEVIERARESRQLQRRRQTIVWFSFAATIAAGVLLLGSVLALQDNETSTNHQTTRPTLVQTRSQPSKASRFEGPQEMWSDWHSVAKQLPVMREIWTETWSNSQSHSALTASVTSGLRPVATTMSSAIRVIGQRILPTYRAPSADDGQAAGSPRVQERTLQKCILALCYN
jgi:hypothetical protein